MVTTTYKEKNDIMSLEELKEAGIKPKKNTFYTKNNGKVKTYKYSNKTDNVFNDKEGEEKTEYTNPKQISPNTLEKISNQTGLTINKIKNNISSMARHFKQGFKGVERKKTGGMVIKGYSRGGSVSRKLAKKYFKGGMV
tara:strand:+ start:399 stop:815 length:417 start_codon:yes stop_codon:yes gene_type:complete